MRITTILLTLALPASAAAQGIVIPRCPRPLPDRPIIECLPNRPEVVRTRSDVKVELRDRVLRYEVEERFVNNGGTIGEADYMFPLPKGAAFRDLKLSIDGQMVAGETMNAADARRIYEDIVRRQKDPALVEWMGHGMLRTRIFPFQAGEERRIVVRFESVAEREGDAVRVDYFRGQPFELTRRTMEISGDEAARRNARGRTNFTLTYRAGGELGESYSPTHELDVERDEAVRRVAIRSGGPDITVLVSLRKQLAASVAVLTNATRDEQGYALITVTPPSDMAGGRLPRDVTFVLDASGSMSGRKMEQAKAAGRDLLRTLTERDRFRVIDFSTDVRSFRDEFVFATEANVRAAIRYLDSVDPVGSTNISGALEEALRPTGDSDGRRGNDGRENGSRDETRVPLVIFMTDGAATVGLRDPAAIARRAAELRNNARVFSVGMGADVNVSLIEQLAIEGRGTAQFVRPDENVERFVELLAGRLRAPLLTDVRITTDGSARLSRLYPQGPQDIFAGQDLVYLVRYDGDGPTNVIVQGRAAGGRAVRWSSERNFAREERENTFVPRLWATQRIGWLAAEKRRNGGSSEIDEEIRRLGERFGIPTEFTSYLVLEPGMVATGNVGNVDTARRRDAAIMRLRGVTTTGAAGGAPAPAAAQFEAAKSASEQRDAKSVAAADAAVMNEAATAGVLKRAGSKLFKNDGDKWTDVAARKDVPVYKVKAYSRSYFALLEKLPELRQSFAVSERVVVSGRRVSIEVVDDARELTETEVQKIIAGW